MLDTIPTNIRPSKNGNVRCHNLTFRRGHSIYCYILQFNRTLVMSTLLTLPVPVTTTPEQQQQQQNKSTHPNATCKDNTADTRATVLSNIFLLNRRALSVVDRLILGRPDPKILQKQQIHSINMPHCLLFLLLNLMSTVAIFLSGNTQKVTILLLSLAD
ncbi:hypothetical protein BDF14DRAFT_985027 [Spinellus fusiger]|nr:hypothetical protein BDF14DRAFT_985027 [Spinellus fusiger]